MSPCLCLCHGVVLSCSFLSRHYAPHAWYLSRPTWSTRTATTVPS